MFFYFEERSSRKPSRRFKDFLKEDMGKEQRPTFHSFDQQKYLWTLKTTIDDVQSNLDEDRDDGQGYHWMPREFCVLIG